MNTPVFDFDIDVAEENRSLPSAVNGGEDFTLPENCRENGETGKARIRVYISSELFKELKSYSSVTLSKERGSVLVGRAKTVNGVSSTVITGFIPAKYACERPASMTFTHDTWNFVYKELEAKHPGEIIVGWHHTHPGYGVFLSGYDLFIQNNFFNLPFQTALVIDPVANTSGFFCNTKEGPAPLGGFYEYD